MFSPFYIVQLNFQTGLNAYNHCQGVRAVLEVLEMTLFFVIVLNVLEI
jgi:hypothetical protein